MTKTSVIIPAHNSGGTIRACLSAVCLPGAAVPAEIIVVDDGSTDLTPEMLAGFPVRVLRLEGRRGAAAARNAGAKLAAGDILVFMDADVLPAEGWLDEIEEAFISRPDADAVQGVYDADCPEKNLPSLARNYYKCYNASKLEDGTLIAGLNSYCFAVRRDIFERSGGFDPAAEKTEDVELGRRLAGAGSKILLNKKVAVKHLKRYTFAGLLKCDYHKVLAKAAISLKGGRGDGPGVTFSLNKAGAMSAELLTLVLAAAAPACGVYGLAFGSPALLAAAGFCALALIPLNFRFFLFMRRRAGFMAAAGCLAVYFCEMAAASAAVVTAAAMRVAKGAAAAADLAAEKLRWGRKMVSRGTRAMPEQVTLFVTDKCNLKCGHCFYRSELNKGLGDFSLDELRKILPTMGRFSFVSLTGGEPFLRGDLPEIAGLLAGINGVRRISIPTNGYFTQRVLELTGEILKACGDRVSVLVKVSIDGIGGAHDAARGVSGSFERAVETLEGLKRLKAGHKNLKAGVLLTASARNEKELPRTAAYVMDKMSPDIIGLNFLRGETGAVRPADAAAYRRLYGDILKWLMANKKRAGGFYYGFYRAYKEEISGLVGEISETGRYPMPCYAGRLSAVIDSALNVSPCELLGRKMGNLRETGYDFRKLWLSGQAAAIKEHISAGGCCCTHECNLQINSFFNPARAARLLVRTARGGARKKVRALAGAAKGGLS